MGDEPVAKRTKLDGEVSHELVDTLWEHYRNYLDSLDQDDDQGDGEIDEIVELIDTAKKSILKPPSSSGEKDDIESEIGLIEVVSPDWKSRKNMIPVLMSVAYYHLADDAISQYLSIIQQQRSPSSEPLAESAVAMNNARNLLILSLEWYPFNAATWSMGANFGRMSQSLSLSSARKWYEMAVRSSVVLRQQALNALDDKSVADEEKEWIELLVLNQILGVEYEDEEDENEDEEIVKEEGKEDQDHLSLEKLNQHKSDDNEKECSTEHNRFEDQNEGDEAGQYSCSAVEDQNEGDEAGQYSCSAVESTSRFMCAMLWSMEGRHDRALFHLKPFRLTHRLHPNVWKMPHGFTDVPSQSIKPPLVFQPPGGIIPPHLYDAMVKLFAPNAAYWKESDYSSRGYYSFFHEIDNSNGGRPTNLIEEIVINHLLPRAQQCLGTMKEDCLKNSHSEDPSKICGFEWWAHTRPIQANLGHNLHFDTDESMLDQEGKVTHPILSSVLYLTGGENGDSSKQNLQVSSPAGATIILDETPDSKAIGKNCWQGIPKDNTFLIFPGNRLHGVLPCPGKHGKVEQDEQALSANMQTLIHGWNEPDSNQSTIPDSNDPPHRLTFMVGFWTRNVPSSMNNRHLYGPCGPLPPCTEEHSWIKEIHRGYEKRSPVEMPIADKIMKPSPLPQVSPAWEQIENNEEGRFQKHVDVHVDRSLDRVPIIPHGIDHRFFVQGAPHCFRQSLFEDRGNIET